MAAVNGVRNEGGRGFAQTIVLLGALGLIALPACRNILRRWRLKHPHAADEPSVDESLQETFPASDPPASRYFDIPENRK